MSDVMWIVFGMMAVTFIPRFLPFVMMTDKPLPRKVKKFLEYVPYAALGALIIPGAINAIPEAPLAVMAGMAFAVIYSLIRGGMIISIVGGILAAYLVLMIGV